MKKRIIINNIAIFLLLASWPFASFSQDVQISQYDAFPLYVNPAFTGHTYNNRLSLLSRMQWMKIEGAYRTYGVSFDGKWERIKSGFGLLVFQDETSGSALATSSAGGLYSYHLRLNKTLFIHCGTKVSYMQQRLDPEKLTFADQLIRNDGSPTVEIFDNLNHNFLDVAWGSLIFFHDSIGVRKFTFGFAMDHLNIPDNSFMEAKSRLPVKFSIHASGLFRIAKDMKDYPKHLITFSFLYKKQLKWEQAETGISYIMSLPNHKNPSEAGGHKKIIIPMAKFATGNVPLDRATKNQMQMPSVYVQTGMYYRGIPIIKKIQYGYPNHDAVVFLLGVNYLKTRIAYTFDLNISQLGLSSAGGTHEISLSYRFPK